MSGSTSNFGNSIFDALTNPGVDALLGMTQGFASAAMPTRMPTPLGAVLGMGVGGALPGIAAGQNLRKLGMSNQFAQNQYDAMRAAGLAGGGGMVGGGGGGSSAPFGAPQVSDPYGNAQPLISPARAATMAQLMAMNPDTARAAAPWLEMLRGSMPAGGGSYVDAQGVVHATPGALPFIAGKAAAETGGAEAGKEPYQPPIPIERQVPDANGKNPGDEGYVPTLRKDYLTPRQAHGAAVGPQSMATPTSPQQASIAALASIPDPKVRQMAVNAALSSGMPIAAWAPWISGIHTESGWNQNAPNGAAGEVGIGQVKPGTAQMVGVDPSKLSDTPTNLLASARYFGQKWQEGQGNPVAAFTGYNSGSVAGKAGPDYVEKGMGRLASWGYPVPGQRVANFNTTSENIPAPGTAPPQAAPSPMIRVPPQQPGPDQFAGPGAPRGQPMGIPGAPVLTPQQQLEIDRQKPYELRPGGMHINPGPGGVGGQEVKNPELKEITNPDGTRTLVHVNPPSPFAPEGTPGGATPVYQGDNRTPIGNAVSPDVQEARTHVVTEFLGKDQDAYAAAKNTQGWLTQIDHAADVMNKAGGMYQSGNFAPQRLALMSGINDVGRTIGVGTPFNEKAIAEAEELRKATTTAGFELSSHYEGHARQAAATIQNATSAVPGMTNSPQGVKLVSAGINEGAQSAVDVHEYKQARYNGLDPYNINPKAVGQAHGAGLETAETDYYKRFTPEMYSARAISTAQPVKIDTLDQAKAIKEFEKYLPGTFVVFPNGKTTIVPPRPDAPPIPGYIQRRIAGGQ